MRGCRATKAGPDDEQCPAKSAGAVSVVKRIGLDDNKHCVSGVFVWIEQGKHELGVDRLAGLKDLGLEAHEIISKKKIS